MKRIVQTFICGFALLLPLPILAQTPIGSQFQVNTYTTGDQGDGSQSSCGYWKHRSLDVASDTAGNFVVVWQSRDQDGDSDGIFGQRFDSSGVKQGSEFQVNVTTASGQWTPVVATDVAGDFVVAWNSFYPSSYDTDIFARRFDSSGAPSGSEFQVSENGYFYGGYHYASYYLVQNPEARIDDSGKFVVVWEREGDGYDGRQIMGRRYDSSGTSLGGVFQVSDDSVVPYPGTYFLWNRVPDVGVDPSGGFVVVWMATHGYLGGYAVPGRRFDSAGSPQGGEFQVNTQRLDDYYGLPTYSYWESSPAITGTSDGRYLVVWSSDTLDSERLSGAGGGFYDAAGRFLENDGTPAGPDFRITTTSYYSFEGCPTVAEIAGDKFVVVWQSSYADRVHGQLVTSTGDLVGPEFVVDTGTASSSRGYTPVVAAQGSEFVVVWTSAAAGSFDVFGQRFDASEPPACTSTPRTNCREQTRNRGSFRFREPSNPARKSLAWRAPKLEATTFAEFGDPFTDTDYALCVYDESGASQPVLQARMPAGDTCNLVPCWTELSPPGKAVRYLDSLQDPDGIRFLLLRSGDEGTARVSTRGRSGNLDLPSGALTPPVTVQLQASNGLCVTTRYDERIRKNEPGNFRARPGSPSGAFLDRGPGLFE